MDQNPIIKIDASGGDGENEKQDRRFTSTSPVAMARTRNKIDASKGKRWRWWWRWQETFNPKPTDQAHSTRKQRETKEERAIGGGGDRRKRKKDWWEEVATCIYAQVYPNWCGCFFSSYCVKWAPFSILHNFTSTDVIALRYCQTNQQVELGEFFVFIILNREHEVFSHFNKTSVLIKKKKRRKKEEGTVWIL